METERRDIEYDAFEKLDDATQFAFRNSPFSTGNQDISLQTIGDLLEGLSEDVLLRLEKLPQDAVKSVLYILVQDCTPLKPPTG